MAVFFLLVTGTRGKRWVSSERGWSLVTTACNLFDVLTVLVSVRKYCGKDRRLFHQHHLLFLFLLFFWNGQSQPREDACSNVCRSTSANVWTFILINSNTSVYYNITKQTNRKPNKKQVIPVSQVIWRPSPSHFSGVLSLTEISSQPQLQRNSDRAAFVGMERSHTCANCDRKKKRKNVAFQTSWHCNGYCETLLRQLFQKVLTAKDNSWCWLFARSGVA